MLLERPPAERLRGHVSGYWGYEEVTPTLASRPEELVDLPFGHRRYTYRDPQGHEWAFVQVLERGSTQQYNL